MNSSTEGKIYNDERRGPKKTLRNIKIKGEETCIGELELMGRS